MALPLPYTYFQCPCAADVLVSPSSRPNSRDDAQDALEEEKHFNPKAPRSNFNLHPLESLLYCEECQQIRCPKCVLEEIAVWYCPNCLFEVPGSSVRGEGTRCSRNCFECPCCTSPMTVTSLHTFEPEELLAPTDDKRAPQGPFILTCHHCAWSSLEVGLQFESHQAIRSQLSKRRNVSKPVARLKQEKAVREEQMEHTMRVSSPETKTGPSDIDNNLPQTRFTNLRNFYRDQLAQTSPMGPLGFGAGDYAYGSPSSLSRIMGLYTGGSVSKPKSKSSMMREALGASEGLLLPSDADESVIEALAARGWEGTTTKAQRDHQQAPARFKDELQPVSHLLRTRRSNRCRSCRHILTKLDNKITTSKFRICLVAINYIPRMTIRLLPTPNSTARPALSPLAIQPHQAMQFILTLKNPLFESVKITLATPSHTPGRISSRVTILCPQFDIGANIDVWDEALTADSARDSKKPRERAGSASTISTIAEAGKVYERGRNWSSVVVEVVPGDLSGEKLGFGKLEREKARDELGELREDEDVLEIPVFVRVEWEAESHLAGEAGPQGKEKGDGMVKRELAYWTVLGVGRIVETA